MPMPMSPRGRPIIEVEGTPGPIILRGNQIERLGGQMRESAGTLETLKTRTSDQQGKAIESLQESIGDSYQVLYEAADLYEPVGPVITTYGEELSSVKPRVDGHAEECETLWQTYQSLPGQIPPRGSGGLFQPDEDSDEAEQNGEEDDAKQAALDAWESEAELFDGAYDTWEEAFDTAVENIGDEMAGSIKDGFWDNWGDLIGKIGDILSIAAAIAGIVAMFVAGPLVALIAVGLAIAALAITVAQYTQGEKEWYDVALGVVGVIPVTKAGSLLKLAHGRAGVGAFGKGIAEPFTKVKGLFSKPFARGPVTSAFRNKGMKEGFSQILTGTDSFKSVHRAHKGLYEGGTTALAQIRNSTSVRNLAGIDYGATAISNFFGHSGRVGSLTGIDTPSAPKPMQPFL